MLQVCAHLPVVAPDPGFAETFAPVAAGLRRQGTPIATMDLLIACMALGARAALLTANRDHFDRIAGLRVLG